MFLSITIEMITV